MAKLQIDLADGSSKVVEVDDSFLDLSPEQQEKTVVEIRNGLQSKPDVAGILSGDTTTDTTKPTDTTEPTDTATVEPTGEQEVNPEEDAEGDDTWIGQTIGGTGGAGAGAAAGAYAGSFLAPFTFGISVPIGALLGGAAGGYFGGKTGERVEQSLRDEDAELWKAWDDLDDKQRQNIYNAGVEEGVWGLVPGVGGAASKGARVLFKGGKDATIKNGLWLASKIAGATGLSKVGGVIGKLAPNIASRGVDRLAGYGIKGSIAKSITENAFRPLFKSSNKTAGEIATSAINALPTSQVIDWLGKLSPKAATAVGNDLIDAFAPRIGSVSIKSIEETITKQLKKELPNNKFSKEQIKQMAADLYTGTIQKSLNSLQSFGKKGGATVEEVGDALEPFISNGEVAAILRRWGWRDTVSSTIKTAGQVGAVRQGYEGVKETYDSIKEGDYAGAAVDASVGVAASLVPLGIGKVGVKAAEKLFSAGKLAAKEAGTGTIKQLGNKIRDLPLVKDAANADFLARQKTRDFRGSLFEGKNPRPAHKPFEGVGTNFKTSPVQQSADDLFSVKQPKAAGAKAGASKASTAKPITQSIQSQIDEIDASLASVAEQARNAKGFTGGTKQVLKDARKNEPFKGTIERLENQRSNLAKGIKTPKSTTSSPTSEGFSADLFDRPAVRGASKASTAKPITQSVQSQIDEIDNSFEDIIGQAKTVLGEGGGRHNLIARAREHPKFGAALSNLEKRRSDLVNGVSKKASSKAAGAAAARGDTAGKNFSDDLFKRGEKVAGSPEVGKIPDAIRSKLSNVNIESLPTNPKRMLGVVEKQLGVSKPTNTKEALEYLQTMSGVSNELLKTGSTQANRLRKELTETVENISKQFGIINNYFFNKGGKALSNKISKIHGEGYDAPGQAYAIAKSMGYNYGGKAIKLNDGGSVNAEVVEDIIEGAHTPDTVYTHLPQGAYIVNAATTANPKFRQQLLAMGGTVIKKDFNPIDPKHPQAVPAMVAIDEIMIKPSQARKHNDYLEAINQWGRGIKSSMGT